MKNRSSVLVVDDDEMVCRVLERVLGRECDVQIASRGEDALSLIREGRRFDLILTDFAMPHMDGGRLVELIRRVDRAQADRVIFITANSLSTIVQTTLTHTVIDKPFSPRILRDLVARVTDAVRNGYFPEYSSCLH
jgi:two-component system, response regulator PhcR